MTQQQLFETTLDEPRPWEDAAAEDVLLAEIVFNRPVDSTFHYVVPDDLRGIVERGQRVKVPFGRGNQLVVGYCVGLARAADVALSIPLDQLKWLYEVVDEIPLLSGHMLELTRWIAGYYLCPWGQVLDAVVPAGVRNQAGTKLVTLLAATAEAKARRKELDLTPKQAAALEHLCLAEQPMPLDELMKAVNCGTAPINALRQKGYVTAKRARAANFSQPAAAPARAPDLVLNPDQQQALDRILEMIRSGKPGTALLYGVTGSGKTEVYIRAIQEVVSYGRQAIVLVPEISLTPQTIRRFRSRFSAVAVLHSHLGDAERHWHWQQIAAGKVQVVVGARSAVFAPTPHLGLIVIDEEHETSFKQDSVPRYHARDVARRRAELESIPLVLGSATPTLESWHRAQTGQDVLLRLPKRVEGLPLPPVIVVDVRHDPHILAEASIGRALHTAMLNALNHGGQVILLLNLRGYSPVLWCRACGAPVKCPHCDISLTWHKDVALAVCHSCDYRAQPPANCPACGHPGLKFLGTGTQRLEKEVRARFPKFECLRMDSDAMRRPGSHDRALEQFRRGEVRILLGTQMIAKGLDFPHVTLVGVVNADTALHQPDLRSSERTFHLIAQVAGRTGRSNRGGRVLVQSTSPAERSIVLAADHDYLKFAAGELEQRRAAQAPPFTHLTRVILRGPIEAAVQEQAKAVGELLRSKQEELKTDLRILGPAPCPVAKLKDLYRYHFQLSAPEIEPIQTLWRAVAPQIPAAKDVEYVIDVDAVNMQ